MIKKLHFILFALVTTILLQSCNQDYKVMHPVYAGYQKDVTVYDASLNPIKSLSSRTEVTEVLYDPSTPDDYSPVVCPDGTSGYIKSSEIQSVGAYFTLDGERKPSLTQKLEAANSPISAALIDGLEVLHYYSPDFHTGKWTIAMIFLAFIAAALIFFGISVERVGFTLLGLPFLIATYCCAFVLFVVQHPFEDSSHTSSWGWFLNLLVFIGLLCAVGAMWMSFNPAMSALIRQKQSSEAMHYLSGINVVAQVILLIIYGICLWLFKGAADWLLWAMLGTQVIFSLIVLVRALISCNILNILGSLLYIVLFPFFFIVLGTSAITMGAIVLIITAGFVSVGSIFTQPNSGNPEVIGYDVKNQAGITTDSERWK